MCINNKHSESIAQLSNKCPLPASPNFNININVVYCPICATLPVGVALNYKYERY